MSCGGLGSRVLLFSGSFDPLHLGHITAAEIAARELAATKVIFFPNRTRHGKSTLSSLDARTLRLARALACFNDFKISKTTQSIPVTTFEVANSVLMHLYHEEGMPEVAREIRVRCPGCVPIRISGSDSAHEAHQAGALERDLLAGLSQAVIARPGFDVAAGHFPSGVIILSSSGVELSSSELRDSRSLSVERWTFAEFHDLLSARFFERSNLSTQEVPLDGNKLSDELAPDHDKARIPE